MAPGKMTTETKNPFSVHSFKTVRASKCEKKQRCGFRVSYLFIGFAIPCGCEVQTFTSFSLFSCTRVNTELRLYIFIFSFQCDNLRYMRPTNGSISSMFQQKCKCVTV